MTARRLPQDPAFRCADLGAFLAFAARRALLRTRRALGFRAAPASARPGRTGPVPALLLALIGLVVAAPALAQGDPSFNLVNRSGQTIREIYVSPTEERYWGRDLLENSTLADGGRFPVRLSPSTGCLQDVRVVFADGRPEERRRQDTCRVVEMVFGNAGPGAVSDAGNPSFNLVNHGGAAIREVYVSSVRQNDWGRDRLGSQVLTPGRFLAVRLALGECANDVRIIWMDGRTEERRRVDTCRLVNVVFE